MDPAILTVCTIPYNMMADQHAMEMNEKVRVLNEIIRQIHQRSVLPVRLFDEPTRWSGPSKRMRLRWNPLRQA